MTCIIGCVRDGNVHMIGDKMASNGFTGQVTPQPKVFTNNGFIFGYTTSFRMGQLLQYSWNPPSRTEGIEDDVYLYRDVVNSFVKLFKDNDYGCKNDSELETGEFIFGWGGRLFRHQSNHSLLEAEEYVCEGSGTYHAEAAMCALLNYSDWDDTEVLLSKSLEVVAKFVTSVSAEYDYLVLEKV